MTCTALPLAQGATHTSVTWGPAWHPQVFIPGHNQYWFDTYEQPAQGSLTSYITGLAPQAGPNWVGINNYGSSTTGTNVYALLNTLRNLATHDLITTFHVGDFYFITINGAKHYGCYGPGGTSNGILDMDLALCTTAKNKFTFIWTCVNGGLNINPSGGYYTYDNQNKVVGMAFAWTQKGNMATNGYLSPDNSGVAYIGFENTSKYLTDNSDFKTYNYGDFCKEFYNKLYVNHYSVKEALNAATAKVTGGSSYYFSNTVVYNGYTDPAGTGNTCRMRVFGDGNMVLPY
jgi:hypothetical protein